MLKRKLNIGAKTWESVQFCPVSLEKDGRNYALLMHSISSKGMHVEPGPVVNRDSLNSGGRVVFEVKTPYGKSSKYNGRISRFNGTEEFPDFYVDFGNTVFESSDPILSLIDSPF